MPGASDRTLVILQERLGYRFADAALLREALTHRSWLNESGDPEARSNERLEYLGDAALEAFVSRRLYLAHPDAGEGWMTTARSALVRNEALAEVARGLRLGQCLTVGAGIANDGGRDGDRVLSCALEAVVGAVWLDGGDSAAHELIGRLLEPQMDSLSPERAIADAKSRLQHFTQARDGSTPSYRIVEQSGPPHDRWFRAEVTVNGAPAAMGEGRSKQAAETAAAAQALDLLSDDPDR